MPRKPKVERERDEFDDQEYLEKKGWRFVDFAYQWCWQQPKTKALFTLKDALETQKALERENRARKFLCIPEL